MAQALIDATFAECPRFFGLPLEEKMRIHVSNSQNNSGYTPLLEENTDPTAKGDLHEAFDLAHELPEIGAGSRESSRAITAPINGPRGCQVSVTRIETYYRAMHDLGRGCSRPSPSRSICRRITSRR